MSYWVKRIILKTGEIVTEKELSQDENLFPGAAPVIGDTLLVSCRGRQLQATVIWGNWPRREQHDSAAVVPLRVQEI